MTNQQTDPTKFPPAPSDAACDAAWDQIMGIAKRHALVIEAYGGVATLAVPTEQRSHGLRAGVLKMHEMTEAPK
jgi:hypothetical protein